MARVSRRSCRPAGEPAAASSLRPAVYEVVAQIPRGKVTTYGRVATLAGYPGRARQVGYALAATPEGLDLPWHRVINAQGRVSPRTHTKFHELQRVLLEEEGIVFAGDSIDLGRFGWEPGAESGPT